MDAYTTKFKFIKNIDFILQEFKQNFFESNILLVYRKYAQSKLTSNNLPDWGSWTVEWIFHYIFNIQVVDVL